MFSILFFFSSRRRHTRLQGDWSSDVCSSDLIIVINGPVYRKLLLEGYIHWREERLLIPLLHELPILRRYLSFISYRIWDIVSERSLLAVINEKISLLQILLKTNWHNFTLCQLLKLCWEREEMKAWRNNILMKFLYHPNLASSK